MEPKNRTFSVSQNYQFRSIRRLKWNWLFCTRGKYICWAFLIVQFLKVNQKLSLSLCVCIWRRLGEIYCWWFHFDFIRKFCRINNLIYFTFFLVVLHTQLTLKIGVHRHNGVVIVTQSVCMHEITNETIKNFNWKPQR